MSELTSPLALLVDVDTGIDDALALAYLFASPRVEVRAVTCVAGNAAVEQVLANTLAIADACDARVVPIAAGSNGSLQGTLYAATEYHGADGLAGVAFPAPGRAADPRDALAVLREAVTTSDRPLTLLCLGPVTNAALFIQQFPAEASRLARIVIMGGAVATGNATAVAEFNAWQDPDALDVVVRSAIPVRLYPLDALEAVPMSPDDVARVAEVTTAAGRTAAHILAGYPRWGGELLIGDAGAAVVAADPSVAVIAEYPVTVITDGPTRGQTVVDRRPGTGEGELHGVALSSTPVEVVMRVDAAAIIAEFAAGLRGEQHDTTKGAA